MGRESARETESRFIADDSARPVEVIAKASVSCL